MYLITKIAANRKVKQNRCKLRKLAQNGHYNRNDPDLQGALFVEQLNGEALSSTEGG